MTVREIQKALSLSIVCSGQTLDIEIDGGYASDMLSCVMAGAQQGNIWVTLLTHLNVIAVAVLLEIPAIIITENAPLAPEALAKAEDEGIVILQASEDTYTIVGKLYALGVK
ncbi:serine kinase [candidate division KSB3 bacterium]|uniref:Serine kinase n=1 Tax=candidate division KSB3 bacterium TaxID=2044937 RepID=A0A2G6KER1_9BACT|nr:MAG: serine kinase [candidate division KSB3 bacterium]